MRNELEGFSATTTQFVLSMRFPHKPLTRFLNIAERENGNSCNAYCYPVESAQRYDTMGDAAAALVAEAAKVYVKPSAYNIERVKVTTTTRTVEDTIIEVLG